MKSCLIHLIVDDNSPDGTGDMVADMARDNPRIHLLHRSSKLGIGTAYLAGFLYAIEKNYSYVIQMDADFSHKPIYLHPLLTVAELSCDVVLGSRNIPGGRVENWSRLRKLISRGGSAYARLMLGMPLQDITGGFKCFRVSALRQLDLDAIRSNGYAFQIEMNYRCYSLGLRMCEIPITFPDRVAGKSKMSMHIVLEAAYRVLMMRLGIGATAPVVKKVMLPSNLSIR